VSLPSPLCKCLLALLRVLFALSCTVLVLWHFVLTPAVVVLCVPQTNAPSSSLMSHRCLLMVSHRADPAVCIHLAGAALKPAFGRGRRLESLLTQLRVLPLCAVSVAFVCPRLFSLMDIPESVSHAFSQAMPFHTTESALFTIAAKCRQNSGLHKSSRPC
jgi:hypothetical protein